MSTKPVQDPALVWGDKNFISAAGKRFFDRERKVWTPGVTVAHSAHPIARLARSHSSSFSRPEGAPGQLLSAFVGLALEDVEARSVSRFASGLSCDFAVGLRFRSAQGEAFRWRSNFLLERGIDDS